MPCPSTEELFDLLRGNLPADRSEPVRAHVGRCSRCESTASWLEGLVAATSVGPLPDPPAAVLERACRIGDRTRAPRDQERRRVSWATLIRQTFGEAVPVGIRGRAAERRLLFSAEDAELDVEIAREATPGGSYRVTGQLMFTDGEMTPDLVAVLWSDGVAAARAAGDRMGVFVFSEVPGGSYRLEVWVPDHRWIVRAAPVAVGERTSDTEDGGE